MNTSFGTPGFIRRPNIGISGALTCLQADLLCLSQASQTRGCGPNLSLFDPTVVKKPVWTQQLHRTPRLQLAMATAGLGLVPTLTLQVAPGSPG